MCAIPCISRSCYTRPGWRSCFPNWVAWLSYFVAVALLVAFRVGPEERMMLKEFGNDYEAYRKRTRYLIPGIW